MTRKKDPRTGLTEQQEIFCQEYFKNPIMSQALTKAYPKAVNWKRNSVDVQANKLLNNPKINRRICELSEAAESALKASITLNKRKILDEIINQYNQTSTNGAAERTNSVALLKLMAQISKLLDNTPQTTVNIQNNTVLGEVSDYLNL